MKIKHKTLARIPPIHIKKEDGCKLGLQMPESIILIDSTKNLIDKTKKDKTCQVLKY